MREKDMALKITPKEMALKKLQDFNDLDKTRFWYYKDAKHYASLIVDGILEWYSDPFDKSDISKLYYHYWKQVQKEIEKL